MAQTANLEILTLIIERKRLQFQNKTTIITVHHKIIHLLLIKILDTTLVNRRTVKRLKKVGVFMDKNTRRRRWVTEHIQPRTFVVNDSSK